MYYLENIIFTVVSFFVLHIGRSSDFPYNSSFVLNIKQTILHVRFKLGTTYYKTYD